MKPSLNLIKFVNESAWYRHNKAWSRSSNYRCGVCSATGACVHVLLLAPMLVKKQPALHFHVVCVFVSNLIALP